MANEFDEGEEDIVAWISESMDLADELVAGTIREELDRTRASQLKDVESDLGLYGNLQGTYVGLLDRLRALEHGILHRLNQLDSMPADFERQLKRFGENRAKLEDLLARCITIEYPNPLDKETFWQLDEQRPTLEQLERQLEAAGELINTVHNQEMFQLLSIVVRKTARLRQDIDSLTTGLNTLHEQTIVGLSNRIYHDEQSSSSSPTMAKDV